MSGSGPTWWAENSLSQSIQVKSRIISLQNTAVHVITFSNNRTSKPLYTQLGILQFRQQIDLQNALFVNASLNKLNPLPFSDTFTLQGEARNHASRNLFYLVCKIICTAKYGIYSIRYQCILTQNNFIDLDLISPEKWPNINPCNQKFQVILFRTLNYKITLMDTSFFFLYYMYCSDFFSYMFLLYIYFFSYNCKYFLYIYILKKKKKILFILA